LIKKLSNFTTIVDDDSTVNGQVLSWHCSGVQSSKYFAYKQETWMSSFNNPLDFGKTNQNHTTAKHRITSHQQSQPLPPIGTVMHEIPYLY